MPIKKIAVRLAAAASLAIVLDIAIGAGLRHFYFTESSGFQYPTTYAMEQTDAEELVFGSSRANHHYVPEIFEQGLGLSFYNAGRDGQGILFHTAMLKSVAKRHAPKVVILEYYGDFAWQEGGYDKLSALLPYYRDHEEIRSIVELKGPYEKLKLLSSVYPYNSELLSIAMGNLSINKARNADHQGYAPLDGVWPEPRRPAKLADSGRLDDNKIAAFREFIAVAKGTGAKVFVVDSPIFMQSPPDAGLALARAICAENGVAFLDHTQDPRFVEHRELFKDISHLNHDGARQFSSLIAGTIRDHFQPEIQAVSPTKEIYR
jgi:hypothetical protein